MSVAAGVPGAEGPQAGEKVILSRDPGPMWKQIESHWAGDNHFDWESLAMLHLLVHCRWRVVMIAKAFNLHKGQVSRRVHACLLQLAEHFEFELDRTPYGRASEELSTIADEDEDLSASAVAD